MSAGEATLTEHRARTGNGDVHTRDHAGAEPASVMRHRFPENLHIYDDLLRAVEVEHL